MHELFLNFCHNVFFSEKHLKKKNVFFQICDATDMQINAEK